MPAEPMTQKMKLQLDAKLGRAFTPHAPVSNINLFRGRIEQVRAVVDAVRTTGLHAVLYGERGVGKTSLATLISDFIGEAIPVSRVNCTAGDTFDSLARRAIQGLGLNLPVHAAGFTAEPGAKPLDVDHFLPPSSPAKPDAVAALLSQFPPLTVLIFDEFDRVGVGQTPAFADLIKSLSDRRASATILLVGVAQDVGSLIQSHASIERCLRQILLPRMSDQELEAIISGGLKAAGFTLANGRPRRRVLAVSRGFPHFTHLLMLSAGRAALDSGTTAISDAAVLEGLKQAVAGAEASLRDAYHVATVGTKKNNLWREVVAACATADSDDRGSFSSRALTDSMAKIVARPVQQQTVAFHLGRLCEPDRGPMLERFGKERRYRYRFVNPLLAPFIVMKSMSDGIMAPS